MGWYSMAVGLSYPSISEQRYWLHYTNISEQNFTITKTNVATYLKKKISYVTELPYLKQLNILQLENLHRQEILQKSYKIYFFSTQKYTVFKNKFSCSIFRYHCRSTNYTLSLVSAIKLKDLSSPGAFRAAVRRGILAGDL